MFIFSNAHSYGGLEVSYVNLFKVLYPPWLGWNFTSWTIKLSKHLKKKKKSPQSKQAKRTSNQCNISYMRKKHVFLCKIITMYTINQLFVYWKLFIVNFPIVWKLWPNIPFLNLNLTVLNITIRAFSLCIMFSWDQIFLSNFGLKVSSLGATIMTTFGSNVEGDGGTRQLWSQVWTLQPNIILSPSDT